MHRTSSCLAFAGLVSLFACTSADPGASERPVTCDTYCDKIGTTCSGIGVRQYRDGDECRRACALLPLGRIVDGDVNSIGCRMRHLEKGECNVAGAFGGDVCGTRCNALCTIIGKNCSGGDVTNKPFNGSEADCNEGCPGLKSDPSKSDGPDAVFLGGDTLQCRSYHLILSINTKNPHCGHAGTVSDTCKP